MKAAGLNAAAALFQFHKGTIRTFDLFAPKRDMLVSIP